MNKMIKSIIIIYVRISGISKECTSLTQSHFCVCPKPGPWFPKSYILVYFVFEWFQVRVVVLFVHTGRIVDLHCLYWQNCWPSLFKLSFHKWFPGLYSTYTLCNTFVTVRNVFLSFFKTFLCWSFSFLSTAAFEQ